MIVIGEKLNSSNPGVGEAIARRDTGYLAGLIRAQRQAGAAFLDINTAISGAKETEDMLWLMGLVRDHSDCGICVDTMHPPVALAALAHAGDRPVMVNSVTLSRGLQDIVPVAARAGAWVVGLPLEGAPAPTARQRARLAAQLLARLEQQGIPRQRVLLDGLTGALAADDGCARLTMETLAALRRACPGAGTVLGVSNVSWGLPRRPALNAAMFTLAAGMGLTAAILDPTDPPMQDAIAAVRVLLGQDPGCAGWIGHARQG